jgi:hypothetical protein
MKLRRLILLWCVTAIFLPVQFIKGDSPANPNPPMKSKSFAAFYVTQTTTSIILYFNLTQNIVSVSVEDEAGCLVYDTDTNATFGSSICIDTAGWDSGNYTITVTNSVGGIYTTEIDIP